jgi:CheY-like chemotaxis protein
MMGQATAGAQKTSQKSLTAEPAQAQAALAQRMEIVGRLTGGIVHDFNNILTVIIGTIGILAEAVADRPDLAAITGLIDEAATRGADLTTHLLAFTRGQPSQPREVDVNSLLVDAARSLRPTLGERIETDTALAADAASALVDPKQLMTAILNLAIIARDAMPEGGKLTFETRNAMPDEDGVGPNGEVAAGDEVMVAVNARGHGVSADHPDRALPDLDMDPKVLDLKVLELNKALDLNKVLDLVRSTNGRINVDREAGRGTSVKIYFPRAKGFVQPLAEAVSAGASETILIVEDDALVRNYVVTQVQSLGYRTLAASNADEALAMIDRDEGIDLLFTDVIMPGLIDGRRLATEAQARRPSLRVLYTSSYAENALVHGGRPDAAALLAKPYRKIDLANMIRTALAA